MIFCLHQRKTDYDFKCSGHFAKVWSCVANTSPDIIQSYHYNQTHFHDPGLRAVGIAETCLRLLLWLYLNSFHNLIIIWYCQPGQNRKKWQISCCQKLDKLTFLADFFLCLWVVCDKNIFGAFRFRIFSYKQLSTSMEVIKRFLKQLGEWKHNKSIKIWLRAKLKNQILELLTVIIRNKNMAPVLIVLKNVENTSLGLIENRSLRS